MKPCDLHLLKTLVMKFPVVIFLCLLHGDLSSGYDFMVNMEKTSVCTTVSEVRIGLYDTANIFAEPLPISKPTRSSCAVKFISTNGDGFKIFVRDLVFGECEVYIKVYEDLYLNNAKHAFGCQTNVGGLYRTMANTIIVRLEKPGPESHSYKFYLRLALNDGPDIGGEEGGDRDVDTKAIGTGALVGIIVASLIGAGIAIAVIVYCIFTWRKKEEEKELERSMSTLFPPARTDTDHRDGTSVHSSAHVSWHSSKVPSENPAYNYPAYRTQASISEKAPKCNSIDSKSYDSENTDGSKLIGNEKPKVKSAKKELDSLRRTIFRIERDKERDKEEELRYLEKERDKRGHYDHGYHDDPLLDRRDRNLTSGRHTNNRPVLNAENIKNSLRSARDRGRSFGSDSNMHKSLRSGRSQSSRSKHKGRSQSPARSNASSRDWDNYSDRHEHRSRRDRHDSTGRSRSGHRSSSAPSRRNREDREYYSDYDYETRDTRDRHRGNYRDRDAYSEEYSDDERYSHKSYRSSGHRARSGSEGHRTRAGSTGRRRR